MAGGQHLYEVAEMIYEGQVPCVLRCDLVLARQLQAVVEEGPDLAPIKPSNTLLLGAPAQVPRHLGSAAMEGLAASSKDAQVESTCVGWLPPEFPLHSPSPVEGHLVIFFLAINICG